MDQERYIVKTFVNTPLYPHPSAVEQQEERSPKLCLWVFGPSSGSVAQW
jgi:hypothetical protein